MSNKLRALKTELKMQQKEIAVLKEKLSVCYNASIDTTEHHVLCIGNSITIHEPLTSIGWYSNHGMAASARENDYVHQLEIMLQQKNSKSTVTPINIAKWERNYTYNIDSVLNLQCVGKDVIVIRLGENVLDVDGFNSALPKLIEKCSGYAKNVVITGLYWTDYEKERVILNAARKYHLQYVPLDWIWDLYQEECSPNVGDTIMNEQGEAYPINGEFIITHPNDKGMELIANSIYNAL